jgi:hypothetical protein
METKKVSKKALKSLLNDSMREAIGRLELPQPTKKVEKLINKSSKRLATEFAGILKKQNRKSKASEKALADVSSVLTGKKSKKEKKGRLKALEA